MEGDLLTILGTVIAVGLALATLIMRSTARVDADRRELQRAMETFRAEMQARAERHDAAMHENARRHDDGMREIAERWSCPVFVDT